MRQFEIVCLSITGANGKKISRYKEKGVLNIVQESALLDSQIEPMIKNGSIKVCENKSEAAVKKSSSKKKESAD